MKPAPETPAKVTCCHCSVAITPTNRATCAECLTFEVDEAVAEATAMANDRFPSEDEAAMVLRDWIADHRLDLWPHDADLLEHVALCMSSSLVFTRKAVA